MWELKPGIQCREVTGNRGNMNGQRCEKFYREVSKLKMSGKRIKKGNAVEKGKGNGE